jgi:hypothetical protein
MDTIKIILAAIGVIAIVVIALWLIGIISAILWLLLWAGLIAAIGYGSYKLFFAREKTTPRLEEKTPVVIADMKDADRTLEEYKRKYLSE